MKVWAALWFGISVWGMVGILWEDGPLASPSNLIYLSLGASFLALLSAHQILPNMFKAIYRFPFSWAVTLLLALLWLWGVWAAPQSQLPPLWSYLPFSLLWFWFACGFLLETHPDHRSRGLVLLGAQIASSLLITLLLLELLLRLFASRLPEELTNRAIYLNPDSQRSYAVAMPPQIPIRNYNWANQSTRYTFYNTDGDLFNRVSCLAKPAERQVISEVEIDYSPEGFRQSTSGQADLVVIGDSFVFAAYNPEPFWMGLYPDVVSMGAPGSGTVEQSYMLEAFAPARQPKVILMAFFAGNDLQDNWRFQQAAQAYLNPESVNGEALLQGANFRPLRMLSAYAALLWMIDEIKPLQSAIQGKCPYPITDAYGNELVLFDSYVQMGTIPTEELRQNEAFILATEAISRAKALADSIDAAFILMYIPDKSQAHWPGILEAGLLPQLAENMQPYQMSDSGFIPANGYSAADVAELLAAYVDNQRDLLAEFARTENILWLDLTPPLQRAAAAGQPAYFYADTHLSNEGHLMVRQILHDFLAEQGLLSE